MNITIEVLGILRDLTGLRTFGPELPEGATVGDAVKALLSAAKPDAARFLVDASTGEMAGCHLVLNTNSLRVPGDLSKTLSPGDHLVVIPPLAGG